MLFKPKHPPFPKIKESPSPRKKKKKLATGIEAGIELKEQQPTKKKKVKQLKLISTNNDIPTSMSPLDVTVPIGVQSDNIEPQISGGLLTTSNSIVCFVLILLFILKV